MATFGLSTLTCLGRQNRQEGRVIGESVMKIWSLLPSATEILFALGLGDQVTGVTHECDLPARGRRQAARHDQLHAIMP